MDSSTSEAGRRTVTPAVLVSALFTVACAAFAIAFVAARGGLQLPIAPSSSVAPNASAVAVASPSLTPSPGATASAPPVTATPSPPSPTASPVATVAPTPSGSPDPLAALPGCPGLAGCYEYEIRRNDSLSGVASRYVIPVWVVLALNPEITDPGTIVVGHTLYLGRDPFLRLPPCPDAPDCSLYVVRAGDGLSAIAARFGLTLAEVLAVNPEISDANSIRTGQAIRLPHA